MVIIFHSIVSTTAAIVADNFLSQPVAVTLNRRHLHECLINLHKGWIGNWLTYKFIEPVCNYWIIISVYHTILLNYCMADIIKLLQIDKTDILIKVCTLTIM